VSSDETANAVEIVEISVTVGVDSGPDRFVRIPLGSSVRVTLVNPNGVEEYHLHGYDVDSSSDIPAGTPAVFEFEAITAGHSRLRVTFLKPYW